MELQLACWPLLVGRMGRHRDTEKLIYSDVLPHLCKAHILEADCVGITKSSALIHLLAELHHLAPAPERFLTESLPHQL